MRCKVHYKQAVLESAGYNTAAGKREDDNEPTAAMPGVRRPRAAAFPASPHTVGAGDARFIRHQPPQPTRAHPAPASPRSLLPNRPLHAPTHQE